MSTFIGDEDRNDRMHVNKLVRYADIFSNADIERYTVTVSIDITAQHL